MNATILELAHERLFLLVVNEIAFAHELLFAVDDLIHRERDGVGLIRRELDVINDMLILTPRKLLLIRADRFTGPSADEFCDSACFFLGGRIDRQKTHDGKQDQYEVAVRCRGFSIHVVKCSITLLRNVLMVKRSWDSCDTWLPATRRSVWSVYSVVQTNGTTEYTEHKEDTEHVTIHCDLLT